MSNNKYILAIDQGTSSTKSLIFNKAGIAVAKGSEPLHTSYLDNGFVEQDPEEIVQNVLRSVNKCLKDFISKGFSPDTIASIGISNQRETFVIWDKDGKPLHPAVVWQCKRSVQVCEQLKGKGLSETNSDKKQVWLLIRIFLPSKLIWLISKIKYR
jgi:glycerol kinase